MLNKNLIAKNYPTVFWWGIVLAEIFFQGEFIFKYKCFFKKLRETADKKTVYKRTYYCAKLYAFEDAKAEEGEGNYNAKNSARTVIYSFYFIYIKAKLSGKFLHDKLVGFGRDVGVKKEGYGKGAEH